MSTFWIVGIILNVTLTGLILYWLIKQAKPRTPDPKTAPETDAEKPGGDQTQ